MRESIVLKACPEKACPALDAGWISVFPCDKREAFTRRSCSSKKIERNGDSQKSPYALATTRAAALTASARIVLAAEHLLQIRDIRRRLVSRQIGLHNTLGLGKAAL